MKSLKFLIDHLSCCEYGLIMNTAIYISLFGNNSTVVVVVVVVVV